MSAIEIFLGLAVIAITFIIIERRSTKKAEQKIEHWEKENALREKTMLENSVGWGYQECRTEARRIMDDLHPNLDFINDQTTEFEYGWSFKFAIPTGNANEPWEYLIGCSNELFINKHTGKVEALPQHVSLD